MFYTTKKKLERQIFYGGSESDMTPEMRLIYEILSLFLGNALFEHRTFNEKSINVNKMKKKVKTTIKRTGLEDNMKSCSADNASHIFNSLTHLYDNTINISDDNGGSRNDNNFNSEEIDISEQDFDESAMRHCQSDCSRFYWLHERSWKVPPALLALGAGPAAAYPLGAA